MRRSTESSLSFSLFEIYLASVAAYVFSFSVSRLSSLSFCFRPHSRCTDLSTLTRYTHPHPHPPAFAHLHLHLHLHTYTYIFLRRRARLGRLAHPPARLPTHSPTHPLARSLQVTFARQYQYYSDLLRSDSILTYSYLLIQIQTIYAFRETSILPLLLFDFLTFECPVFRWSSVATYIPCKCLFSYRA